MLCISVTLLTSHPDMPSSVVKLEHLKNMYLMSVILPIFQPVRLSEVRFEQYENMPLVPSLIVSTLSVSQPDRSREVRLEHLWNMTLMLVTSAVFQFEMPSIVVKFEHKLNMPSMKVTAAVFHPERSSVVNAKQL